MKILIFLTCCAYALHDDKRKAINAGCSAYITKPVKKEELLGLIERCSMAENTN